MLTQLKWVCTALLLGLAPLVQAQDWPTKPIQVIVPFPPGSVDAKVRIVTEEMSKILGQPLVMINKPGAGMLIGTEQMVRSTPDGYTIGVALQASTWISPLIETNATYSASDMTMLGVAYEAPMVLVAGPKTEIRSVQDLLSAARASPGKLNFAAPTGGSIFRITFEMLKTLTGIDVTFVPYRGLALALKDIMGGQVEVGFADTGSLPLFQSGQLRPLAVTSLKRWPQLPDVPSLHELGIPLESKPWVGFAAPKGLAPAVEKRLTSALAEAVRKPEVRSALEANGLASMVADPSSQAMRQRIDGEIAEFKKNVKPGTITFN
ncbi:MAG: tripartite tricarboxylate transporter substrate binding protein [Simplicispira suum]|uniref:Bug family tripartite tricarboxylate transporter substrate binding protein n=1 Tax=Simplicispira suum TaxID=2109915 RepID=UPI001C6BB87B|nr:tripartite tricarboxylate transporter substrate binding protein [Simplicispira suum]MBW7833459.1 tripartite tricarboxylate transporter substrate binding protein [Simplicispira suum]